MVYSLLHSMAFGQGSLVRETQLVSCINDLAKSMDRGFRTDIAIFDFHKVYSTVFLTVVCKLSKLSQYGMSYCAKLASLISI